MYIDFCLIYKKILRGVDQFWIHLSLPDCGLEPPDWNVIYDLNVYKHEGHKHNVHFADSDLLIITFLRQGKLEHDFRND